MCRTCTETQRLSKMLNVSLTYPSLLLQLWHISVSTKFHSHFQTWCKSIGQIFQNKHRGSFYFFQVLNLFLFLFIQRIFWAKYILFDRVIFTKSQRLRSLQSCGAIHDGELSELQHTPIFPPQAEQVRLWGHRFVPCWSYTFTFLTHLI